LERFIVKIEGAAFEDVDEIELPRLPQEGEPIETRLGTCLIVRTKSFDGGSAYAGEIVCRLP
jgi:hypothetical protein